MFVFLCSLISAVFAADDCACTGDNSLIPESSTFFESGYGTYCDHWDKKQDYCKVGHETYNGGNGLKEAPEDDNIDNNWCSQPWCYVQKDCIVGEREWVSEDEISSETDAKQTVVFKDDEGKSVELYYSYLHCGPFSPNGIEWPDFEMCQPRENPIDVYLLVDGSSSINQASWINQGFFLSQLVKTIDHEEDRVGIVQFSGKMKLEYTFDDAKEDIVEGLLTMTQLKGGTKTDTGIATVLDQWEKEDYSGKWKSETRHKVFVLVTDGVPNPEVYNPCLKGDKKGSVLDRLKTLGTVNAIIAVGMALEDRALLACLVENPLLNIVEMDDFESFDQYRDPTGSQNLLCADPSTLQKPSYDQCDLVGHPRIEKKCNERTKCRWRDGKCFKKPHCHKLGEEDCGKNFRDCRMTYLRKKKCNGKKKTCFKNCLNSK